MTSMVVYYFAIKLMFFFSLFKAQLRFATVRKHPLLLALIYSLVVAFLSMTMLPSPQDTSWAIWQLQLAAKLGISPWRAWVGETFVIATIYFWLLARFDEGILFFSLFLLGFLVILF